MTIINPWKEYWLNWGSKQWPPFFKSAMLPTELLGLAWIKSICRQNVHWSPIFYPIPTMFSEGLFLRVFGVLCGSVEECLTHNPGVLGLSTLDPLTFLCGSVHGQDISEPQPSTGEPRKDMNNVICNDDRNTVESSLTLSQTTNFKTDPKLKRVCMWQI